MLRSGFKVETLAESMWLWLVFAVNDSHGVVSARVPDKPSVIEGPVPESCRAAQFMEGRAERTRRRLTIAAVYHARILPLMPAVLLDHYNDAVVSPGSGDLFSGDPGIVAGGMIGMETQ